METFKRLSDKIGPKRVIWRYDPIIFSDKFGQARHFSAFSDMAKRLFGYTSKAIISFVDYPGKIQPNFQEKGIRLNRIFPETQGQIAKVFGEIAKNYGMTLETCAERMNPQVGIPAAHCIDGQLFSKLLKLPIKTGKDTNQRPECGCLPSVDIGAYDTCDNGCLYCYARRKGLSPTPKNPGHDPNLPVITGEAVPENQITDRPMPSCVAAQLQFDL